MEQFVIATRNSLGLKAAGKLLAIFHGGLRNNREFSAIEEAKTLNAKMMRGTIAKEVTPQVGNPTLSVADDAAAFTPNTQGGDLDLQLASALPDAAIRSGGGSMLSDDALPTESDYIETPDCDWTSLMVPSVVAVWGQRFARSRQEITEELFASFSIDSEVMLTPSTVDFDRWLGVTGGSLTSPDSMASQVDVMRAVADWFAQNGKALATFVGIDPWKVAEPDDNGRNEDNPVLSKMDSWLRNGHALGVKLYPPMGFRACRNAELADVTFPTKLRDLAYCKKTTPGALLDASLMRIYKLCLAHDAPVMAHCADSNSPAINDGTHDANVGSRADPTFWIDLLTEPAYACRDLRINLAHFGGIWDIGTVGEAGERSRAWAKKIAEAADQPNVFPNLYADLSYASALLADSDLSSSGAGTIGKLQELCITYPGLKARLMYGSDWEMVGKEKGGARYWQKVHPHFYKVFTNDVERSNFQWRNAARFLGLGPNGSATKRLRRGGYPEALLARFAPDEA